MNSLQFTQKGKKATLECTKTNESITGMPARIANAFINSKDVISNTDLCELTHNRLPDYFIMRSNDVHVNKVKKFLEPRGYIIKRIRLQGYKITYQPKID